MKHATNFVKGNKISKKKQKKRWKKNPVVRFFIRFRAVFYVCLLVILLGGVFLSQNYAAAYTAYQSALTGKTGFEDAQKVLLEEQDFSKALILLENARTNFEVSQENLRDLKGVKFVPFMIRQVNAVDALLTSGIQTSRSIEKIVHIADLVMSEVSRSETTSVEMVDVEQRKAALKVLYESLPDLQASKAEIGLAMISLEQIPQYGVLKPIRSATIPLRDNLPMVQSIVDQLVPLAEAVPQIAGYPSEKTYLFLLQNNTEMRATGGFIGTYGILKLKDGDIAQFTTDNVYNLDEPVKYTREVPVPWQFNKYIGISTWFFRDSNWSPDFPEAARTAVQFYHEENGPEEQIVGVIAVTPTVIESLLTIVGDIEVDGILFTPENVVDVLQEEVEVTYREKGVSDADRKQIISDLSDEIMTKLLTLPKSEWQHLWETLEKDFAEKHMLMYLFNHELQQLVENQGWDGSVKEVDSDFAMIVDSNMASLKSDPGVKRTVTYKVETDRNGEMTAHLSMHYKNEGTFSWKSTRYRTYTRVYVPLGSELISHEGVMDSDALNGGAAGEVEVKDELDKTRFGAFISIEPQEEGTLTFHYKLPDSIEQQVKDDEYSLLIQKQSGTIDHGLVVDLGFNKDIKAFTDTEELTPQEVADDYIIYSTDLRTDKEFEVQF